MKIIIQLYFLKKNYSIKILFLFFIFFRFPIFPANAAEKLTLSIFHTNDIHGGVEISKANYIDPEFPPLTGNSASIQTILKRFKTLFNSDTYILLDAGDFFQGAPVSNLSKGEAVIDVFNKMGYRAITPGNHDFDMGFDNLKKLAQKCNAPMIVCNMIDEQTNEIPELFKPYIILQINSVKIGIIGVITDDMPRLSTKKNIAGLKFINSKKAVKKNVDILLSHEKCDVIIILSHLGFEEDKILAQQVSGIDLIVGGHSHTGVRDIYEDPENHTLITQAYAKGGTLGHVELSIDLHSKKIIYFKNELISLFTDQFKPDKEILSIISDWKNKVERGFDDVIAYTKYDLRRGDPESNLGDLICDALLHRYNADVSFQNSGGIRAEIKKGNITVRDIFNVLPFDNNIYLLKMTGAEITEALEVSVEGSHGNLQVAGIEMVYDPKFPKFKRVVDSKINGAPIEKNKVYTVVTNSYITESDGSTYAVFKGAGSMVDTFDVLRDVVIDYLKQIKNIDIDIQGRIKIK